MNGQEHIGLVFPSNPQLKVTKEKIEKESKRVKYINSRRIWEDSSFEQ